MSCSPCAQRRKMLAEAAARAKAGDVRAAVRKVVDTGRHMIAHPPQLRPDARRMSDEGSTTAPVEAVNERRRNP